MSTFAPARLRVGERARRARHAHHVAVGGDAHALPRQRDPSSISGMSVMQTGQPGPMMTFERARQRRAQPEAGDRLLVAAADVHHRHGSRGRSRSRSRASAAVSARAPRGSRNSSGFMAAPPALRLPRSPPRTSAAMRSSGPVRCSRAALLVQFERRLHVFGRDAADGEADVVEHVVAGRDRLVEMSSRTRRFTPQKSTTAVISSTSMTRPGTPRHMANSIRTEGPRLHDFRMSDRDRDAASSRAPPPAPTRLTAVAGRDAVECSAHVEPRPQRRTHRFGESRVLKTATARDDRQPPDPAGRPAPRSRPSPRRGCCERRRRSSPARRRAIASATAARNVGRRSTSIGARRSSMSKG